MNVAGSPPAVVAAYSKLMQGPPLLVGAVIFGWVQRRRFYWLHGPSGGISAAGTYVFPPDFTMDPHHPGQPTTQDTPHQR